MPDGLLAATPCLQPRALTPPATAPILALGRLKDGTQLQTARAEIGDIAQQLATQYPDADGGRGGTVVPLVEMVVGSIRPTLWLLLSAALLLLLIASINVSGLFLLRFQARQQELAGRSALGASPTRLVCQFTIEAAVLTMIGGAVGICSAFAIIHPSGHSSRTTSSRPCRI